MCTRIWLRFFIGTLLVPLGSVLEAEERLVSISGTTSGFRRERTVEWTIPESLRSRRLTVFEGEAERPGQITPDGTTLLWRTAAGTGTPSGVTFRIASSEGVSAAAEAIAREVDGGVELRVAGRPLLSYHVAPRLADGVDPVYRRSGHIHPLLTPQGRVLTDEFPADHLHQHAIFFAWVNTEFQGRHIDFWNQPAREGIVEHTELLETFSGLLQTGFRARLTHSEKRGNEAPRPVLREEWRVAGTRLNDQHVVDLESRQRAVSKDPLNILKYHYGGFGVRGSAEWGPACDFLTSDGKTRQTGNHTHCRWVRLSGRVGGAECGLAVLSHPQNFRAPQAVRLHPSMPYFAFSPCVDGGFSIGDDQEFVSRYRIIAFDGLATAEMLDTLWQDYAEPLTAAPQGGR